LATALETKIKQQRLLHIIEKELQDLPPLPAVVIKVMQTLNEPSTSAADLSRLISSDQALSGKILRLVNSSYYGFPRRIATITHAIVILGFNTIRNLATSLGVAKAFETYGPTALDRDKFWEHSVCTAVGAWNIARRRNLNAKLTEEVFIGGLLHDVGKLFLDQYFPDQYAVALKLARTANVSVWDAEKTALGIGHVLVGKRVAEKWNFPTNLTAMIAMHHQPAFSKDVFEHVAIVHAANYLTRKCRIGDSGDRIVPALDPEVEKWLAFSAATWESVQLETVRKFEDAKDFLKVATNRETT
jgi:putative nucleotidyltransferase with HDIG domain